MVDLAAGVPTGADRDLNAEARIRRAALRLFAERGYEAATTRAIGAAAGVSPGLLLHYFGSKDGLRDQVDRDVMATVDELFSSFTPADAAIDFTAFISGYGRLLREHGDVVAYMRRSLLDSTQGRSGLFGRIIAYVERLTDEFVARGIVQPPSDPKATAVLQASLGLTSILLGPHLIGYLGDEEPVETRLARAEVELLTSAYLTITDRGDS